MYGIMITLDYPQITDYIQYSCSKYIKFEIFKNNNRLFQKILCKTSKNELSKFYFIRSVMKRGRNQLDSIKYLHSIISHELE